MYVPWRVIMSQNAASCGLKVFFFFFLPCQWQTQISGEEGGH